MRNDAAAQRKRDQRNLNPHAPAIAAMYLYGSDYMNSAGGSMDFWDVLSDSRKRNCRELVKRIRAAKDEP